MVTLVMTVAAMVQSTVGFGLALLAAPALVFIEPQFVPGPAILAALCLTVMVAIRERRSIDLRQVKWIVVGRVPGTLLGAALLVTVPSQYSSLLFGVMVLLAVATSVFGPAIAPTRATLIGAGTASGIMGTVSAIGGPPVALLLQHEQGRSLRGTLSGYFVCSTVITLCVLTVIGQFNYERLCLALLLVPGCVVGFLLAAPIRGWIDRALVRPLVLALSALSGSAVLVRAWWG